MPTRQNASLTAFAKSLQINGKCTFCIVRPCCFVIILYLLNYLKKLKKEVLDNISIRIQSNRYCDWGDTELEVVK